MIVGNFINFIFIFAVVYGVRFFFEPKFKNPGTKKLVIDIVSNAILALIFLQLINSFFH